MQGLSKFLWHKLRACATMKGKNLSQTTIANDIEITENKAQYDANAKRLLANKVILAHIMHETMEEYKNCSVEEIKNLYIEGTPIVAGIGVNQDTSMPKIQGRNVESNSSNEYNIPMETDKEDEDMGYFSERIYNQGVEDGIEKGKLTTLFDLVKKGTLTLAVAAAQFNMTEAQFIDAGKSIGLTL